MNVFQSALSNDNVYQEALLNALIYKDDVAIGRSYLLPSAQFEAQSLLDRQSNSGAMVPKIQPPYNSVRSYDMRLSLLYLMWLFFHVIRQLKLMPDLLWRA